MMARRLLSALALAAMTFAGSASAQDDPGADAQAAAARLQAASALLQQAEDRRDRVAALTETVQAYESGLIAMRDGLRRAAIRQRSLEDQLAAKSTEVARLLGVLQSMGRAPAPLLLLHPSGPVGTARTGMMAASVTPALQTEVETLRLQLDEVNLLRRLQEEATSILSQGLEGAQTARSLLSEAISNRTDLPQRFSEDAVQTAVLVASTSTLTEFAQGMTEAFLTEGTAPGPLQDKGALPLPVQGQVLRRFNAPDAAGVARPGVILAARPRALVPTPTAATVLFRGPLLDYGNVVILEPDANVLFVIAGLAEVFGEAGQILPAGAPLGLMGGEQPDVDAILTDSDGSGGGQATQTLYLEVRDGQTPQDPAEWFALE